MPGTVDDVTQFFGSKVYYEGEECQDPRYTQEDLFTLKAENGILLWSAAIDLRQQDAPGAQLPMEFLPEKHCLMFHYTNKEAVEAFEAIIQLQSNEIFTSKYRANAIFGYGVYGTSKAPHQWPSKKHLLLNNFWPAKTTWMEKRKGSTEIEWPSDDVLYIEKETLMEEDWNKLLNTQWAEDFVADLEKTRAGAADFCLTVVCDKDLVKDGPRHMPLLKLVETLGD
eukprot:Skav212724  [mRNA]  locus=scaffold1734:152265:153196:- [translate_table: standard]